MGFALEDELFDPIQQVTGVAGAPTPPAYLLSCTVLFPGMVALAAAVLAALGDTPASLLQYLVRDDRRGPLAAVVGVVSFILSLVVSLVVLMA